MTTHRAPNIDLINEMCLAEVRVDHLRNDSEFHWTDPRGTTILVSHIPHGCHTIDIYDIMKEYGLIRKMAWMKDRDGYEKNCIYIMYEFRSSTEAILSLYWNQPNRTSHNREFRKHTHVESATFPKN